MCSGIVLVVDGTFVYVYRFVYVWVYVGSAYVSVDDVVIVACANPWFCVWFVVTDGSAEFKFWFCVWVLFYVFVELGAKITIFYCENNFCVACWKAPRSAYYESKNGSMSFIDVGTCFRSIGIDYFLCKIPCRTTCPSNFPAPIVIFPA